MSKADHNEGMLSRRQVLGTDGRPPASPGPSEALRLARRRRWTNRRAAGRPRPASAEQVRGQARRARRILRILLQRPVWRGSGHRLAVDARDAAHPGVQPMRRDGLGTDQREPEGDDGGSDGRDARAASEPRAEPGSTATAIIRTCRSPTAPTMVATSSSTTKRTPAWRASAAT